MKRTARADEGAGQLQIGVGLDKHPRVLLAEAEEAELVVAPARDALILELLEGLWLRRRHTG